MHDAKNTLVKGYNNNKIAMYYQLKVIIDNYFVFGII